MKRSSFLPTATRPLHAPSLKISPAEQQILGQSSLMATITQIPPKTAPKANLATSLPLTSRRTVPRTRRLQARTRPSILTPMASRMLLRPSISPTVTKSSTPPPRR
ncbi:hypothetical protein BS47DRAFT_1006137 [Hydnum rufescens UP504]|uniref:Uncharacterized protein n=1 Tax=Hydnum rufescens UP504 TaxID=1448309 RepID=A0A9P6E1Q4_9AGAM|nr:hypothetical protein BS47DRAFT_1006137 [Hydnum rufescens UP504]